MPSNLAGLGVIYNDSADLNQTIFQLNAVPGSLTLVHVDGKVINPATYSIEESVLTLVNPPSAGAWIYVVSGQGGTFVPQSYVDQAAAPKANKSYVDTKLTTKADKGGGFAFTGPVEVQEPTEPMHPVTLQLFDTLGDIASPQYVDSKTNDKVTTSQFSAAMDSVIGEDQKGAPNGVPDLNGIGEIKLIHLPSKALTRERYFYRSGNLTATVGGDVWVPRFAGFVRAIQGWVFNAPTGSDVVVDILKNEVSIFANPADRLTIVNGTKFRDTILPSSVTFLKGDVFKYNIVQIGSTTPGAWLNVTLEYEVL